jgi:regulator of protease activity HflC (stomatin/prohibitin superfamily)
MASPKRPPIVEALLKVLWRSNAPLAARFNDWLEKNLDDKLAGASPSSSPTSVAAPTPSRAPGFGNTGAVPQPITPASPITTATEDAALDARLVGKWIFRALFFILPAVGVIKYIGSGKWQRNTDFQEFNDINSYINAFSNAFGDIMNGLLGSIVPLAIFIVGIILVAKSIRVVPQQRALVIERLGRFHTILEPGLRFTIPFIDRISAKHDLREVPLDVPPQICITKDNTQLQVDGILYFQITDPRLATYGSSNPILAITQLAQTTLRSVIGKLELDKTFEERDTINHAVVNSLDAAAMNWGVKVLRYEIKDLTPPKEILHAMQAQITAEREKRALIAASEGRKQEQINIAVGQKEASIAKSEGNKIADINQAQGEAAAILAKAEANAEAIRKIAAAIESQGGLQAVNLKVAEQYVAAFAEIAKAGNTIVVPQNLSDIAGLVTAATSVLKAQK